ncbi:M23 family metallopeptidase [Novosphingobium sp.]|uniref:LysM peptidoglycan-binding domain-containing M23 family metallopeptidase n=1 Tax=Novosphingobium sp. TaxID=1874826 RepID=UPI0027331EC3|nr:M23 family metallopeptidase [Novosphingobium sp.]MDP3907902.1 M23 family metallopeptidase [Novosphingobium sp.]
MPRAALLFGVVALLLGAPVAAQSSAENRADDPRTATEYVVKPGETLGGIANRVEVPRLLIIEANGLKAPYLVRIGQKLVIPRRRTHTVKDGETGFGIALDYGVPWPAIAAANGLDSKAAVKAGQKLAIPTLIKGAATPAPVASAVPEPEPTASATPTARLPPDTKAPRFAWPHGGKVRREFSPRGKSGWHDGIDLTADKGDAVRAAAAGKVIFAGQGPKEYGLTVIVYHTGRWTTTYSFLDKITVKDGEAVKQGERIGLAGETGLATSPQVHFEVRRNRVALDPVDYLPAR